MRVIIDPHRDGCDIYTDNGIAKIVGTVFECCDEIIKRTTVRVPYVDNDGLAYEGLYQNKAIYEIVIDVSGVGQAYYDRLRVYHGAVKTVKAGRSQLDLILPVTNPEPDYHQRARFRIVE